MPNHHDPKNDPKNKPKDKEKKRKKHMFKHHPMRRIEVEKEHKNKKEYVIVGGCSAIILERPKD